MLTQEKQRAPDHARFLALTQLFRPAIGFNRPEDVLKDPVLSEEDKREILSAWASDVCAVAGRPGVRRLPHSGAEVPLLEVLEALARLRPVRVA